MDRFPALILIGGDVPASLAPELLGKIQDDRAMIDWKDVDPPNTVEALLGSASKHGGYLRLCSSYADYGEFDNLERWRHAHRSPYRRSSDAYCEYDATLQIYDGGVASPKDFLMHDQSEYGKICVPAATLKTFIEEYEADRRALPVERIGEAADCMIDSIKSAAGLDIPPLPPFRIV